ncbi:MAG TPA: cytochrome c [Pyrinomonadaceae bacterium]|nr:cytochrome c [Pyrinomonadaceae bacterium]
MLSTKSRVRRSAFGARPSAARLSGCLLLSALCLFGLGCRMDMQDQPRYEAYEAGDAKFGQRGSASRVPVQGTVARGFLNEDGLLYRGAPDGGRAGGGTAGQVVTTGAAGGGGVGAASPNAQANVGRQQEGDVNVRGNAAGGLPGAGQAAATGGADRFPFPVTYEVVKRGQDRYQAFCAMCHGLTGVGDGMITRRGFQRPPSYHEDRLQAGASPASHFFDVITNGWGAMPAYNYMIPAEDRWAIIAYIRALQLSRRGTVNDVPEQLREKIDEGNKLPPRPGGRTSGERGNPNQGTLTPGEVRH